VRWQGIDMCTAYPYSSSPNFLVVQRGRLTHVPASTSHAGLAYCSAAMSTMTCMRALCRETPRASGVFCSPWAGTPVTDVLSLGLQRRVELQRSTGSSGLGTDVSCRCTAGVDVLALSLLRVGDSRRATRYGVFGWRCRDRWRAQRCYRIQVS
jgi:hypothetical protein